MGTERQRENWISLQDKKEWNLWSPMARPLKRGARSPEKDIGDKCEKGVQESAQQVSGG